MIEVKDLVEQFHLKVFRWSPLAVMWDFHAVLRPAEMERNTQVSAWAVLPWSDGTSLRMAANRLIYKRVISPKAPHGLFPNEPRYPAAMVPYLAELPNEVMPVIESLTTKGGDRIASQEAVAEVWSKETGHDWVTWCEGNRDRFWEGFADAAREAGFKVDPPDAYSVDATAFEHGVNAADFDRETLETRLDYVQAGRRAWRPAADKWTPFLERIE
jgi:hypothetical protein